MHVFVNYNNVLDCKIVFVVVFVLNGKEVFSFIICVI